MITIKRPMLAVHFDEKALRFPYYASPKVDGLRCIAIDGQPRTRSMLVVPNLYVQQFFAENAALLNGLDGELVVGSPTAKDAFTASTSGLMTMAGRPEFVFLVFDQIDPSGRLPWRERYRAIQARADKWPANVLLLPQSPCDGLPRLKEIEDVMLRHGYEGVILRNPESRYKQGRATLGENSLLKVKRFRDAEAVIVGAEEEMANLNPAMMNELGLSKRSSARSGKTGKGTLGALVVQGLPDQPFAGVQFKIGTGMSAGLREQLWELRDKLPGNVVKYRFLDVGTKDAPRHPVFVGFRED